MRKRLLIVGGSVMSETDSGQRTVKAAISDYLSGWLENGFDVYWKTYKQKTIVFSSPLPEAIKAIETWFQRLVTPFRADRILCFLPQGTIYGIYCLAVSKLVGSRFFVYTGTDLVRQTKWNANWKRPILMFAQRILMRGAAGVLVRGEETFRLLKEDGYRVLMSTSIGGSLDLQSRWELQNTSSSVFRLVYVGKLSEGKGVLRIIRAVTGFPENQAVLVDFIGSGTGVREAEEMAAAAAKEHANLSFEFHGWVDDYSYVQKTILASHCMLVPSLLAQPEGLPRVFDEGSAIGIPLVSSSHQSMKDFATKHDISGVRWLQGDSDRELYECLHEMYEQWKEGTLSGTTRTKGNYLSARETATNHAHTIFSMGASEVV